MQARDRQEIEANRDTLLFPAQLRHTAIWEWSGAANCHENAALYVLPDHKPQTQKDEEIQGGHRGGVSREKGGQRCIGQDADLKG